MKKITLFASLFLVLFAFNACNKYPEGPKMSFRSKTERISNKWKVAAFTENGTSILTALAISSWTIEILSSGSLVQVQQFLLFGQTITNTQSGTWEFYDKNTKLIWALNDNGNIQKDTMDIMMLREDEVKLKKVEVTGNKTNTYEMQLLPQ